MLFHDKKLIQMPKQVLSEIFFVACLMGIAAGMSGTMVQRNPNVTGDGLQYTSVVFNAMQGYGYRNLPNMSWLAEPGYGLLTYGLTLAVKDSELAGMLVSLIAYVLLIPTVYLVVRRLGSTLSAVLAGSLTTFYPYLITFSWLNLTDSVYTFFLFLCFAVYCKVLLDGGRLASGLALGVLLGFTTLIRPEGYGVALLAYLSLAAVQLIERFKHENQSRGFQPLRNTLFSALVYGAIMFSFLAFIHQITGAWVITPKTPHLVATLQPSNASDLPLPSQAAEGQEVDFTPASEEKDSNPISGRAADEELFPNIRRSVELDIFPLSLERIGNNWLAWLGMFGAMFLQPAFPAIWVGLSYVILCHFAPRGKTTRLSAAQIKRKTSRSNLLAAKSGDQPFLQGDHISWRDKKILLALLVFFAVCGVYLTTNLMFRYLLPYMIYVIVLLSLLMGHWISAMRLRIDPHSGSWFSLVSVVLVGLGYFFALSSEGTLLLARSFSLPQMNSLPQVLEIKHLNLGARAAGIWMRDNLTFEKDVFIAASKNTQNGCYLILYQMFNRQFPIQGRCVAAFSKDELNRFLQAGGDYYVLDDDSIAYAPEMQPLWVNPQLDSDYGLELIHQDPQGAFQVYRSALNEDG